MIYAIVGRPGSGKSYESVVYHIIPAVQSGRKVVTNVPLNIDYFKQAFGEQVGDLISIIDAQFSEYGSLDRPFAKHEHYLDDWRDEQNRGPLYVIDEAHMVIPKRINDSKILEFYAMHRHYGIDIVLLTQNLRKIHTDIKTMIEMTYYCAKNTAFGSDKTYTKKVRIGDTREVINEEQRRYKKQYFKFYQSHTQSDGSVSEVIAKDVKPIWTRWPFWGSALFVSSGLIALAFILSGDDETQPKAVPNETTQTVDNPAPSQLPQLPNQSPKNDTGFLADFDMYVTGHSKQLAFTEIEGSDIKEVNKDLSFYKIYIKVYHNKQYMFTFTQLDLQNVGYEFNALSYCVYKITYEGFSRIITCADEDALYDENNKKTVFDETLVSI